MVDRMTELKVLGFDLDIKFSFEGQIRSITESASGKLVIMRKALCMFGDPVLVLRWFWSFLLPVLEYCSPLWMSAAASDLGLFDRVVSKAVRISYGLVVCDLKHRRRVAAFCMFYKIPRNPNHNLEAALPEVHVPGRLIRLAVSVHSRYLAIPRCRTVQFGRSFVPAGVLLWSYFMSPA